MSVNTSNIIELVAKLGTVYSSPLNYKVLMAYDLERLTQLLSNNSKLHNKFLNFLDIPSSMLNEKAQTHRNFLKQVIAESSVNNSIETEIDTTECKNVLIKYICFDNIITALKKTNEIIKYRDRKIQIVITDNKIRKLIKCQLGAHNTIDNTQYTSNLQIRQIIKILNDIVIDNIAVGNVIISDISNVKHNCYLTIFFDVNPNITWSNNVGHLWLSGYERELLGLTTHINWSTLLNISPIIYVFSKQANLPLWQGIKTGEVEHIKNIYPKIYKNLENFNELLVSNIKTELIVNANGISCLLHNPYLLYLRKVLDLKPKKHFTDDTAKIFDIFGKLLNNEPKEQVLNELKDIDYLYYKKIQSFIDKIPQQQFLHNHITIDNLTITYKDQISSQISKVAEIDYYTLSSSVSAKDIISGLKTDLMIRALSIDTDAIKFNIVYPDWHSFNCVNKRSIELSKEVLNAYKDNIKSVWHNFLQTDVFKLKFDRDKASFAYKHLERVQ